MPNITAQSIHEEAVSHARAAERSGALAWRHLEAEYTQDIEKILDTLATEAPLAWTLPVLFAPDGSVIYIPGPDDPDEYRYLVAENRDDIRQQYRNLRKVLEINGWEAVAEIRQGWYAVMHGVGTGKRLESGEAPRGETITLFPAGADGILGEVQIGGVGTQRVNRWPEVPSTAGGQALPLNRLEALALHNRMLDALRAEDVDGIVATHRDDAATAIRSYLTDDSTVVSTSGSTELGDYFSDLFSRFRVHDVRLVNRLAESWYVFAELHWVVEERSGGRRRLEFCTAEVSPIDADGRFWVRTGAGTDPVAAA